MIERQIVLQKKKEHEIKEFIYFYLNKASYSHTEIQRTPLGEKIIVYTSRPGLVIGRRGGNILDLTNILKKRFKLENPTIEVAEIGNPSLNAQSVAKRIVTLFEKFGAKRFKSIGYRVLEDIMAAGALGAEIVISGRGVPSARARSWRFKVGHLKKSGDIAQNYINKGCATANLRSGTIGIKVSILKPEVRLPDKIQIFEKAEEVKEKPKEEVKEEKKEEQEEVKKEKTEKKKQEKKKEIKKTKKKEKNGADKKS